MKENKCSLAQVSIPRPHASVILLNTGIIKGQTDIDTRSVNYSHKTLCQNTSELSYRPLFKGRGSAWEDEINTFKKELYKLLTEVGSKGISTYNV